MLNLTQFAGLLIYLTIGVVFLSAVFLLSRLFQERGVDARRNATYECGMETIGTPYVSPNIRFYVFALLFVLFDVEAVFILPWAVKFREFGLAGLAEMGIFLSILFAAFVVAWRKGALTWE